MKKINLLNTIILAIEKMNNLKDEVIQLSTLKNTSLIVLISLFITSCSEDEITTPIVEPVILQKKELIDSIYGTWILNGIGYYEGTSSTTIENITQSEICTIINNKIDGISIGYEIKIIKNDNNTTIDKIYNCGESWIYNSAYLNINVLSDTQARIEEYQGLTIANYTISDMMSYFKINRLFLRVEFDKRTDKRYILIYKKKNTQ